MKGKYALVPYADYKNMVKNMDMPPVHDQTPNNALPDTQQPQTPSGTAEKQDQRSDNGDATADHHKTQDAHTEEPVSDHEADRQQLPTPEPGLTATDTTPQHITPKQKAPKKKPAKTAKKIKTLKSVAQIPIAVGKLQKNEKTKKSTDKKTTSKGSNDGDTAAPRERIWLRG